MSALQRDHILPGVTGMVPDSWFKRALSRCFAKFNSGSQMSRVFQRDKIKKFLIAPTNVLTFLGVGHPSAGHKQEGV